MTNKTMSVLVSTIIFSSSMASAATKSSIVTTNEELRKIQGSGQYSELMQIAQKQDQSGGYAEIHCELAVSGSDLGSFSAKTEARQLSLNLKKCSSYVSSGNGAEAKQESPLLSIRLNSAMQSDQSVENIGSCVKVARGKVANQGSMSIRIKSENSANFIKSPVDQMKEVVASWTAARVAGKKTGDLLSMMKESLGTIALKPNLSINLEKSNVECAD
ncbi:MAG: hypothetical protein H7222_09940 [Methylotenera sp.]|nr:hypothetical protein [Oligoflexia bacterium]